MSKELNTLLRQIRAAIDVYLASEAQVIPMPRSRAYTQSDLQEILKHVNESANGTINVRATARAMGADIGSGRVIRSIRRVLRANGYPVITHKKKATK